MLTCWAKQNTEVCSSLWLPTFTLFLFFCILIAAPVRKYLSSWIAFHFFLLFFMSWFGIIILLYLWHLNGQLSHCNLIAFCSVFKQSFIQTIPTTRNKNSEKVPGFRHVKSNVTNVVHSEFNVTHLKTGLTDYSSSNAFALCYFINYTKILTAPSLTGARANSFVKH